MAKSRREALYDAPSSQKSREAAKPAEAAASPASDGGNRTHAEMMRRFENERRDMHGRHRGEYRSLASGEGDAAQQMIAAHRRHEQEYMAMHARHEGELFGSNKPATPAAEE